MSTFLLNSYMLGVGILSISPQTGSGGANVTCDGRVGRQSVDETFATIRGGNGSASHEAEMFLAPYLQGSTTNNRYQTLRRVIMTFDTRDIPSTATVHSATLKLYGYDKLSNLGQTDLVICACSPGNPADLANSDYNIANWSSTSYARVSYSAWSTSGYNDITLSTNAINKAGITAIGLRLGWDFDNSTTGLTWASGAITGFYLRSSDYGESHTPILVVEFS